MVNTNRNKVPLTKSSRMQNMPSSKSHYICFMCTFPERPCTQAFGAHLLAHLDTEHWSTCPICSNKEGSGITSREKAAEKFDHPLHFFKHVEEMHMRIQSDGIGCPFCDHLVPVHSPADKTKAVAMVFRHIVYECMNTELCLLCGHSVASSEEFRIVGEAEGSSTDESIPLEEHRWTNHRLIFDRFICSSCKCGFYSREKFVEHICEPSLRCSCDLSCRFLTRAEYEAHILKNKRKKHRLLESKLEKDVTKRRYLLNQSYQREVAERVARQQKQQLKRKNSRKEKEASNKIATILSKEESAKSKQLNKLENNNKIKLAPTVLTRIQRKRPAGYPIAYNTQPSPSKIMRITTTAITTVGSALTPPENASPTKSAATNCVTTKNAEDNVQSPKKAEAKEMEAENSPGAKESSKVPVPANDASIVTDDEEVEEVEPPPLLLPEVDVEKRKDTAGEAAKNESGASSSSSQSLAPSSTSVYGYKSGDPFPYSRTQLVSVINRNQQQQQQKQRQFSVVMPRFYRPSSHLIPIQRYAVSTQSSSPLNRDIPIQRYYDPRIFSYHQSTSSSLSATPIQKRQPLFLVRSTPSPSPMTMNNRNASEKSETNPTSTTSGEFADDTKNDLEGEGKERNDVDKKMKALEILNGILSEGQKPVELGNQQQLSMPSSNMAISNNSKPLPHDLLMDRKPSTLKLIPIPMLNQPSMPPRPAASNQRLAMPSKAFPMPERVYQPKAQQKRFPPIHSNGSSR